MSFQNEADYPAAYERQPSRRLPLARRFSIGSALRRLRLLLLAPIVALLSACNLVVLNPAGDVASQCRYAWEKIDRLLAQQGAAVSDIVKATTYVTDARFQQTIGECRRAAMKGAPATPHTFLVVQALA